MSTRNKSRPLERVNVIEGVRVRWRYTRTTGARYLCDEHGQLQGAVCTHALAASLLIAEEVLGVRATMPTPGHPATV